VAAFPHDDAVSRIPPTVSRKVNRERLETLLANNLSAAARKIAADQSDRRDVERVRRKLQRALDKGRIEQGSAEEIARGLNVDPETILLPYERPDPRWRELRRHLRAASRLRDELGLPPHHYDAELEAELNGGGT
jgi:hypothetical protein